MLKALVVLVAIVIAVVNISAQSNSSHRRAVRIIGVVRVGPSTTYLKQGMTTAEVVRVLGEPSIVSNRDTVSGVVTYEFSRGDGRVLLAEFQNDLLVSSRTEHRNDGQAGR